MIIITKVASLKLSAETKEELQRKIGSKILKISKKPKWGGAFTFDIEQTEDETSCVLNAYYKYDNKEIEDRHCRICQDAHNTFYINKQYNCARCEYRAYLTRAQEHERMMKSAGRDVITKTEKKE